MKQPRYYLSDIFNGIDTPFICLRARYTQIWAIPSIFILVLYIVKLQLLKQSLDSGLELLLRLTLSACSTYESVANASSQVPRQAALLANQVVNDAMNGAVEGILKCCKYAIIAVRQLVLFFIEMWVGTWACLSLSFIDIVANGALDMASSTVSILNSTVVAAASTISEFVTKIQDLINTATGLINSITQFVSESQPLINNVTLSVESLNDLSLPSDIQDKIDGWRSEVPTYEDAKAALEKVISIPFDALETQVSNALSSNTSYFNASALPVPSVREVQVCDAGDITASYNDVAHDVANVVNILCIFCGIAMAIVLIWELFDVYWRWRRLEHASDEIDAVVGRSAELQSIANMNAINLATMSGLERRLTLWTSNLSSNVMMSWLVHYTCNPVALGTLTLGIMGLVVILLEYIVLRVLKKSLNKLDRVVSAPLNDAAAMVAMDLITWSQGVNGEIHSAESKINTQILGWVHTGTKALNDTLASFMTEINTSLNNSLGNTPLFEPLQTVVDCVIGNKVSAVEKGLTWVHEHSQVTLPTVKSSNYTQIAQIYPSDFVRAKTDTLISTLESQLQIELAVSCAFISAWLLLLICGSLWAIWKVSKRPGLSISPRASCDFDDRNVECVRRTTWLFSGPKGKAKQSFPSVKDSVRAEHDYASTWMS